MLAVTEVASGASSQSCSRSFCMRSAAGSAARRCCTKRSPSPISSIKPHSKARRASMASPVSTSQAARPEPMSRGRSAASTTDGIPSFTSGIANFVPSAATRRSQAAAISRPAPITAPCSRATTGTGKSRIAAQTLWIFPTNAPALDAFRLSSSRVSAPPQKVLPRPAKTTTRRLVSVASLRKACCTCSSIPESKAFAFSGRLRKIRATDPSRSTSTKLSSPKMLSSYIREALKKVSTATLTTVLFKRGLRNVFIQGIFLLNKDAPRMVGEAFTLRYIPAREDVDQLGAFEGRGHPQREAIEACPPGSVLVMDARRDASAATGGDILMTRLMVRGVSGVVTDGGLRDSPTIEKLAWPAYCGARSAPLNLVRHHAVESQVPIGCGGVAVYPGDVVVGDAEGVVVIPAKMAEEVAKEAEAQTEFEDWVEAKVKEGRSIFGLYPPNAETKAEFEAYKKRR